MEDETKERWYQLAQLAAVEQDPDRLVALAQAIPDYWKSRKRASSKGAGVLVVLVHMIGDTLKR
jgi:hypothetical protein